MSKKKANYWVNEDFIDLLEFSFGGSHNFRTGKTNSKYLIHIHTYNGEWAIQSKEGQYYVLLHKPLYNVGNRYHIQCKSHNFLWLCWIAYTHDFYKDNQLPYAAAAKYYQDDYQYFLREFKRYLTYYHIDYNSNDFDDLTLFS